MGLYTSVGSYYTYGIATLAVSLLRSFSDLLCDVCLRWYVRPCVSPNAPLLIQYVLQIISIKTFDYFQLSIEAFFKKSIHVHQRGLARPEFFLLGDGAIALKGGLALLALSLRVMAPFPSRKISGLTNPRWQTCIDLLKEASIDS